jgi:hypothetical protein
MTLPFFEKLYVGISGNGMLHNNASNVADWAALLETSESELAGNITDILVKDSVIIKSAANGGVFFNGAAHNEGLPDKRIRCLGLHDGFIYAGTYDKGVWKHALSEVPGLQGISTERLSMSEKSVFEQKENSFLYVSPNPSTSIVNLKFIIGEAGDANILLLDARGRLVKEVLAKQWLDIGENQIQVEVKSLPEGEYSFMLKITGNIISKRFLIFH